MAKHPLDVPIASDLSQQVLELRRRRLELTTPELDSQNRRFYGLPSHVVQREAFIADRESVQPDTEIVPTWHFRGKGQR